MISSIQLEIIRYVKTQKYVTHNQEKNQPIEIDTGITRVIEVEQGY